MFKCIATKFSISLCFSFLLILLTISVVHAETNLALGKPTMAYKTSTADSPNKAVDGNTAAASTWRAASGDYIKWWQVDLGGAATISKIELCPELGTTYTSMRQNFQILGSNDPTFETYDVLGAQATPAFDISTTFAVTNLPQGKTYRYIRASKTVSAESFSIGEFKVFGTVVLDTVEEGVNIAQGKTVTASGQNGNDIPSNAVDGNTATMWDSSPTDTSNRWFMVDLGTTSTISKIEDWNSSTYSGGRTSFQIQGSNDATFATFDILGEQGSTAFAQNTAFTTTSISKTKMYRYIRVIKTIVNNTFNISELKVFGVGNVDTNISANQTGIALRFSIPVLNLTASDFVLTKNAVPVTINEVSSVVGSNIYNLSVSDIAVGDKFILNIAKGGYKFSTDISCTAVAITEVARNYVSISASATQTDYEPAKAVDQNENTFWNAGGVTGSYHYLQFELANAYKINRVELDGYKGTNQTIIDVLSYRQSFEIRASNDPTFATYTVLGVQGTTAFDITKPWGVNVADETLYRYIRFQKTTSNGVLISEFRVYVGNEAQKEKYTVNFSNGVKEIKTLSGQTQAKANAIIIREAQDGTEYALILALYNENKLVDVAVKEAQISELGEQLLSTDSIVFSSELDLTKCELKGFLWSSLDSIVPLSFSGIKN